MENELENLQNVMDIATELVVKYGFQMIAAVFILIIGWLISRWVAGLVLKLCQRVDLDITLSKFFASLAKIVVLAFVVIIALGKFGISIAPFIAALGAVAFGGTLALQGPLSNYGAGLTIILTRPFVVGDTIKVLDVTGIVEEVKLAYTDLSNEDGEIITIPNKHIVGEVLHNSKENLVVEGVIGVSYDSDPNVAVKLIHEVLNDFDTVASEPAPQIGIQNFGDSAIEIAYRYWVPTKQYYETLYSVNAEVFTRFKNNGVNIPYPQREVKILNNSTA